MKNLFLVYVIIGFFLTAGIAYSDKLPRGLGGINLGDHWSKVKDKHKFKLGSEVVIGNIFYSEVNECGLGNLCLYEAKISDDEKISILLASFNVCQIEYEKKIPQGCDIFAVRDKFISKYGNSSLTEEIFDGHNYAENKDKANWLRLWWNYLKDDPHNVVVQIIGPRNDSQKKPWSYRITIRNHILQKKYRYDYKKPSADSVSIPE